MDADAGLSRELLELPVTKRVAAGRHGAQVGDPPVGDEIEIGHDREVRVLGRVHHDERDLMFSEPGRGGFEMFAGRPVAVSKLDRELVSGEQPNQMVQLTELVLAGAEPGR
jgi:hypothetical protein